MATKKKLLEAAAGAAGGAALNVEEVFSTYLWDGAGGTQTIVNGVDLTEGGLVWAKQRSSTIKHVLSDSERGTTKVLSSNSTAAESTETNGFTSFNSDGFTFGSWAGLNNNGDTYASWTFRKAPKFFDVVTYTGNRVDTSSYQDISHNLGTTPGMIIVKETSSADDWMVYHRSISTDGTVFKLNSTDAALNYGNVIFDVSEVNSTSFRVGNMNNVNANGSTYVAYLFAHNNSDGDFGPTGDQDIIKCGSYTGNGTYEGGPEIDLGFEPQWVMLKNTSSTSEWFIYDSMRGITDDNSTTKYLQPNRNYAENSTEGIELRPTGFQVMGNNVGENTNGNTYIYIAIRRGPMAVPESATDVFAMDFGGGGGFASGFPVDSAWTKNKDAAVDWKFYDRLRGHGSYLSSNLRVAETPSSNGTSFASNTEFDYGLGADNIGYMFRRAPNYFDVVAYTGNGTAGRTVSHNLGVAPEMMWVKERGNTNHWAVYHKGLNGGVAPEDYYVRLNLTNAEADSASYWNDTAPTDSVFTVAGATVVNRSGGTYIAYLFASLDGVSKVGSYTGDGNTGRVIDCGFSNGARFVLARSYTHADNWWLFDSERGIVAGNDPRLWLNTTDAEVTNADTIDAHPSGFIVNNTNGELNDTGRSYIFYAIA
jgi:hypothetical protein